MEIGVKENILQEIRNIAIDCDINRVVLFGSRARGDFGAKSDIDLAVYGSNIAKFCVDLDEMTSTLLKYDVVNMDGAVQEELKESILAEGIILYEKV